MMHQKKSFQNPPTGQAVSVSNPWNFCRGSNFSSFIALSVMSFFLVQIEEPGGQLTLFLAELSGEGQQRMLAQEF